MCVDKRLRELRFAVIQRQVDLRLYRPEVWQEEASSRQSGHGFVDEVTGKPRATSEKADVSASKHRVYRMDITACFRVLQPARQALGKIRQLAPLPKVKCCSHRDLSVRAALPCNPRALFTQDAVGLLGQLPRVSPVPDQRGTKRLHARDRPARLATSGTLGQRLR